MSTVTQVSGPAQDNKFPMPDNEKERQARLVDLEILDTPADERFDRIVRLAANHFLMPVCRVTFVDEDRNWFKASVGVNATQAPRSIAICSHAIMQDEVLVVPDLKKDSRFAASPQVVGGHLFRFYAGAPITVGDGLRIGSLCIMDNVPHPEFSEQDAQYLADLAHIVAHELELHKRSQEKVQYLLDYDELTNLPNRTFVQNAVKSAIDQAIDKASTIALMIIDLDGFKEVNDTRGHLIGDSLLSEVGHRLAAFSSDQIVVGRLSGDEFILLFKDYAVDARVSALAGQVCKSLGKPYHVGQDVLDISASVGVALGLPLDLDPTTLSKFADFALYKAKSDGGNCYRFFEESMYVAAKERHNMAIDLRSALQRNELLLHYQPLVNLQHGNILGYEALVRWQHGKNGMISPVNFINIAEETGQICEIGEWVLRTACQYAATWDDNEFISVNLSPIQFKHQNVVAMVETVLRETGLAAERLELEVTESILIQSPESVLETLNILSEMGVGIALDDFGTGYSSLSYITSFPFSKIKIDKLFVDKLGQGSGDSSIVRLIVALGHSLNTTIVAEGIENQNQHAFLCATGCDQGQGYYYGKPQPQIIKGTSLKLAKTA
ncbi:MAG: putative bifunctional diguanylate cyclase/phosphodiesterase [Hyphomicrobiales bacterium]